MNKYINTKIFLFTLADLINEIVIFLKKVIDIPCKNFAVVNLEKVEGDISQIKGNVKIGHKVLFYTN